MEKITTKVEVDQYYVSEDGNFRRCVMGATDEQKKAYADEIRKYEESACGTLYARLLQRGVIRELSKIKPSEGSELTEEQKRFNSAMTLLDGIMDDEYCRCDYYLFTPQTEEDIKDLANYAKLKYDYSQGILSSVKDDESGWRTTHNPEVGKVYIFQLNTEAEYSTLMSPALFLERATNMTKIFEDLGKKQVKALKK